MAALLGVATAFIGFAHYLNVKIGNALFPGLGTYVSSRETTIVSIHFRTRTGDVHWRIPKAFLSFAPNLKGGEQSNIIVDAAIYLDSDNFAPWSVSQTRQPSPDDKLSVHINASGNHTTRRMWDTHVLPQLDAVGKSGGLEEYKYKPKRTVQMTAAVYRPLDTESPSYIECVRNSFGNLLGCGAHADFAENIAVVYFFSSRHLGRWREMDAKARAIVASLRADNIQNER